MRYKAWANAGSGTRRGRIRPTRRDSCGGRSGECLSRACIACRHRAVDSNTYTTRPLAKKRACAREVDGPFGCPSAVWECTRRTKVRGQGAHMRGEKGKRAARHAGHTQGPSSPCRGEFAVKTRMIKIFASLVEKCFFSADRKFPS